MSNSVARRIADNLAQIKDRIARAAERSGRPADAVRLVAVTKYVGSDEIRSLLAARCVDLGESRPQQLWQRAAEFDGLGVRWHMIGHVQRNKVARTLPLVTLIHSIDSERLAEAVSAAAAAPVPVLLEVNTSGEASKGGFRPEELPGLLPALASMPRLAIAGLMGMARLEGDLADARRDFAALRELRDHLRADAPHGVSLDELSMGMSGDYEVAVEEGATIVRVGSALFEGLQ